MALVDFVVPPLAPGVATHPAMVDYYETHDVPFLGDMRRVVRAERTPDGGLLLRVHIPDDVLRARLADVPADQQDRLNVVWDDGTT